MSKCEICGKEGFHKLSCGNNTARVGIPMNIILEDELEPARRVLGDEGLKAAFNKAIPTLEGDEAEEFIRKAESAERGTVDWSRQMKQMELALNKSRIANRKLRYAKCATPKVKRSKDEYDNNNQE